MVQPYPKIKLFNLKLLFAAIISVLFSACTTTETTEDGLNKYGFGTIYLADTNHSYLRIKYYFPAFGAFTICHKPAEIIMAFDETQMIGGNFKYPYRRTTICKTDSGFTNTDSLNNWIANDSAFGLRLFKPINLDITFVRPYLKNSKIDKRPNPVPLLSDTASHLINSNLTMHGTELPLNFPVLITFKKDSVFLESIFQIQPKRWGMLGKTDTLTKAERAKVITADVEFKVRAALPKNYSYKSNQN